MIANKKIKKYIDKALLKLTKEYQPDKVILFGSYAYGIPKPESDIDLFIIKDTPKRRIDRFCEVENILRDLKGISFQPLVFTHTELKERIDLEDDFILEILEKGKVLYEK